METSPLIASKSMDWFLYDIGLRHERVNDKLINQAMEEVVKRRRNNSEK